MWFACHINNDITYTIMIIRFFTDSGFAHNQAIVGIFLKNQIWDFASKPQWRLFAEI